MAAGCRHSSAAGRRVLVVGLEGGRPDHALANLLVAASDRFAALDIELVLAQGRAWAVRDALTGAAPAGRARCRSCRSTDRPRSRSPASAGPSTTRARGRHAPAASATRPPADLPLTVHAGVVLCITPRPEEDPMRPAPATVAAVARRRAARCSLRRRRRRSHRVEPRRRPTTITLVTHDSFDVSEAVLSPFTDETGITVELLPSGDAGSMLNQAILTKDAPQGDVLFGIDNTFLSRALDEDLFVAVRVARPRRRRRAAGARSASTG